MPLTKGLILSRLFEGHKKQPHVSLMDMLIVDHIALHENWSNAEKTIEGLQVDLKVIKQKLSEAITERNISEREIARVTTKLKTAKWTVRKYQAAIATLDNTSRPNIEVVANMVEEIATVKAELKIAKEKIKRHRIAIWENRVVQCKEDAELYGVIK